MLSVGDAALNLRLIAFYPARGISGLATAITRELAPTGARFFGRRSALLTTDALFSSKKWLPQNDIPRNRERLHFIVSLSANVRYFLAAKSDNRRVFERSILRRLSQRRPESESAEKVSKKLKSKNIGENTIAFESGLERVSSHQDLRTVGLFGRTAKGCAMVYHGFRSAAMGETGST